jgi:hypothetical protein
VRQGAIVFALLVWGALASCGGNPPQIVDYSPERGAKDVSTAAPIRITFDHDVDKDSVEGRLSLVPATRAGVRWVNGHQLLYEHATLAPSTTYEVVLEAGYTDYAGNAYALRHRWSFVTEGPPSLVATTPSNNETGVDPASYLRLEFSRDMNATGLAGSISISPPVAFKVRLDPTDSRRVIVAPDSLLDPAKTYALTINTAARDADGNRLERDRSFAFTTGSIRPLRGWVAFAARRADGTSTGVWIVNGAGFPRHLVDETVESFSWSPDGSRLLIQTAGSDWSTFTPGAGSQRLAFSGAWAAILASGLGYVFIDHDGTLRRFSPEGSDEMVAANVTQAAVARGGLRVAYVQSLGSTSVIWGYDVALRASYQLAAEAAPVSAVSWAPAGNRIAYLRHDAAALTLRVRNLTGTAATNTVASGDIGRPTWLPDSVHIVFAAGMQTSRGPMRKAFLLSVIAPPASLTPSLGMPNSAAIDVSDPVPSPDGHQLAFVSGNQVWIMNADGTRPTPLTQFDAESFPYSCEAPTWTRT